MRRIALLVAGLGLVMVMGALFVAIDGFATNERKAAVSQSIDEFAENQSDRTSRRNVIGGIAKAAKSLDSGVFFSSPVELADALPPAPEGWERRAYEKGDEVAITGEELTGLNWTASQEMLARFSAAAAGKDGAVAVYDREDRLIALRLGAELDDFRRLENGTEAEVASLLATKVYPDGVMGTIDGIAIAQSKAHSAGTPPETYRRFVFGIGAVVAGEVITTAADADLVAVLSALDIAMIEDALPRPTGDYAPGTGFVYLAGDTPPTEVILATPESLAATMLERKGLAPEERAALELVAGGSVTDWYQLSQLNDGAYPVTARMIEVLGPEPPALLAARIARGH